MSNTELNLNEMETVAGGKGGSPTPLPPVSAYDVYRIESGATLTRIARKFHTTGKGRRDTSMCEGNTSMPASRTSRFLTAKKLPEDIHSIYQLSRHLLPLLKECGYRGSERTLRNYLHLHPAVKALFEKGQNHA